MSPSGRAPARGWYPSPEGRPVSRFWDGVQWTGWLTDGRTTWFDAAVRRPLTGADVGALRFVEEVFLPEALARGALAPEQRGGLGQVVQAMMGEAAAAARSAEQAWQPGPVGEAAASPASAVPAAGPPAPPITPVPGGQPDLAGAGTPYAGTPAQPAGPYAGTPYAGTPYAGTPYAGTPVQPAGPYAGMPVRPAGPSAGVPHGARPGFRPAAPAAPREPSRVARWWAETWARIGSDVAVHGLAYLGVLLLFVGVFGLVAFAFGSVAPSMRPVAELASAAVTFAAARMLLRHGATVVARAMEGVAGLILPLMIVTSTVDDFPVPPDLHGAAMPVVLAATCLALAAGYVAWVARHRASGLRFVVAPTMWLGVAMGAIGLGRPIPTGQDVAVPGSGQVAAIAVAVLLTAVLARLASPAPAATTPSPATSGDGSLSMLLARSAQSAALVGSVVVAVLALLTWLAGGWPTAAVAVTAVAIAGTWQLLPRVPAAVADVGAVLWWALVAIRLFSDGGAARIGVTGSVAALGFVVLIEVLGRRARSVAAIGLAAGGLVVTVIAVLAGASGVGWAAGLCGVLTLWAGARRRSPFPIERAPLVLDVLAGSLPVLGLVAVARVEDVDVTMLAAAGLVLVATLPARLARLGRGGGDRFWTTWWRSAFAVTAVVETLRGLATLVDNGLEPSDSIALAPLGWLAWSPVIVSLTLAVVAVLGPMPRVPRVWIVVGLGWWAWIVGAALADADLLLRAAVPAVAGLALVVLAHRGRALAAGAGEQAPVLGVPAAGPEGAVVGEEGRPVAPWPGAVPASLGLAGHLLAAVTVAVADGGWPAELAFVLAALGWAVTAVAADRRRSPVAEVLDRLGALGRLAPWSIALLALPFAAMGAMHLAGVVDLGEPWGSTPLMAAALAYAAGLRWITARAASAERVVTAEVGVPAEAVVSAATAVPADPATPATTRVTTRATTRAVGPLTWISFLAAVGGMLGAGGPWPFVVAGAALVGAVVLLPGSRRAAVTIWTAWLVVVPVLAVVAGTLSEGFPSDRQDLLVLWTVVGASGLLALAALVADGARPDEPRVLPLRRALRPPVVLGLAQLALGLAAALVAPTRQENVVVLGVAGLLLAIALVTGVGISAGVAVVVGWLGWHLLADPGTPWADVAVAGGLVAAGVGVSLLPGHRRGWSRWDVPVAIAGVPAALLALATAQGAQVAPVFTVVGLLVAGAAVRLKRRRVLSEVLGAVGTGIILVGTAEASAGWLALALLALSGAHTAIAAVRPGGTTRTIRQVVGALAAASAWGAALGWLDWSAQAASDATAAGGATIVVLLLLAAILWRLGRSWTVVWGAVATLLSLGALLAVVGSGTAAWSWWHVVALVLLAIAAGLVVRIWPWAPGRTVAVVIGLLGLLVAFSVLGWTAATRVGVLVGVSAACAVGTALLAWLARGAASASAPVVGAATTGAAPVPEAVAGDRGGSPAGPASAQERPIGSRWLLPVTGGGVAAVVLALVIAAASGAGLLAAPFAGATIQVAAAGYAWRKVGMRLAAPVLAWATWAALVPELAAGASASWYTLPVGLALLAVVSIWRAERRAQGLAPSDPPGIALELTGIAFLVVTSWVQAFTVHMVHALLAAAIGIAVLSWGLSTRVRRRFAAGAVVILVSLVLAVMAPLVALVPVWGGAAVWIAVAVLGMVAVLVATLLERGRAAADRAGERGWE